jgi:hypothetical protein
MNDWRIGLASWIIQDGNYDDFSSHQNASFALEFFPLDHKPSASTQKQATHIAGSRYKVNAEVIYLSKGAWVIDFGICAFQQAPPPSQTRNGTWLEATIYLGIDPFFYFDELAHVSQMPALFYDWHVKEIMVETAPFIETRDSKGTRLLVRDEAKSAYRKIDQTCASKDDNGYAEYVLCCDLIDRQPKKTRN